MYFCLDSAEIEYPMKKSGLARSLVSKDTNITFTAYDVVMGKKKVLKGDIAIWQKGTTIYGHSGLVEYDWDGTKGKTIEANTSSSNTGSQSEGEGVYEKHRRIEVYSYFRIKWFTRLV